jgi:amino acid transporter
VCFGRSQSRPRSITPRTPNTGSTGGSARFDLIVFGVGVIIGAGIFTVTGRAAGQYAGPSIVLSFVLGAVC